MSVDSPGTVPLLNDPGGHAAAVNKRILIVSDKPAIHEDFRKILGRAHRPQPEVLKAEAALLGEEQTTFIIAEFKIDSALRGEEALEKVQAALAAGRPYAMAFVDANMPPGWDGIETVSRIWQVYPELQAVICTGHSNYSWGSMIRKLGTPDNLVVLKKPFDEIEVIQLAYAFTRKWQLNRQAQLKLEDLKHVVEQRTLELEAVNRELRREAHERVRADRQLRHAQKMEAVGQLAAGVAHDFNNILTVVHGHATMLLMRLGEEGLHAKSVTEIRRSSERAANLVRQLLMFSRKQLLQFRNVELGEVVRSLSSMLRQLVGEHVQLEIDCPEETPPIFGDRGMIEQIIVNLTVNARDAMPRGGRLVIKSRSVILDGEAVRLNTEARAGKFIRLTVSDNGTGMTANTLQHLFEPFFTTKDVGKGTGLGLATAYGIVKQHHGWIEVHSEPNAGATFEIYFPMSEQESPRLPEVQEISATTRGTETILIAEDEPSLREMVSEALCLQGYRVLTAGSGPAALAVWHRERSRVDLLLTDMVMPGGMMGTDVAAELRRSNPRLKVIFTTGYSPGTAGVQSSFEEGINFLPKPYSPTKLAEMIRKCLDS
jgi:signal transduction histidine kinase/DNA-binding NarL/FixJ family response regulator